MREKAEMARVEREKKRNGEESARVGEEEGVVVGADTTHENFYDFYALASAHLEIRFNSLNFKKLPSLSLAPSRRPRSLNLFHCPLLSSLHSPSSLLADLAVPSSSPENEIAPFCTVGDKILGASRHADPSSNLSHPPDKRRPRHPRGC